MRELYNVGYYLGTLDDPWWNKEHIADPQELLDDIHPDRFFGTADPGYPYADDWSRVPVPVLGQ